MLKAIFFLLQILTTFVYGNSDYLLPKKLTPLYYDLVLDMKFNLDWSYNGTVTIHVNITKPTNTVTLHVQDLVISKASVVQGSKYFKVQYTTKDQNFNFFTLKLKDLIDFGPAKVVLSFDRQYTSSQQGLFLSRYINASGKDRFILATQFEPAHARQTFPCFDEPNLKAYFNVTVNHPNDYHALSNAAVFSRSVAGPITTTRFHTTPKMSTYLLAIVVSDFQTLKGFVPNSKTQVHIYSEPQDVGLTKFALKTSTSSVQYLEELLKVKYPFAKLDGVTIEAFQGGMENWGLIVYDSSILYNQSLGDDFQMSRATYLIAHEVAHQWFGNLVTLDWWDYVWLNEGFATYYGQLVTDKLQPSLRFMEHKLVHRPMELWYDALSINPKSLNYPVQKPVEFWSKFDYISYNKAGAIVRFMRKVFVGFDEGITKYLTEKSYSSVKPDDLFSAISTSVKGSLPTGLTVQKIMKNWVDVGRFPLLTVKVGTNSITVSQEEFTIQGKPDPNKKWCIPLIFANEDPASYEVDPKNIKNWITDTQSSTEVKMKVGPGIVIANPKNIGSMITLQPQENIRYREVGITTIISTFIRVNYDSENWKKIIAFLKGPKYQNVHVVNRAQLVDDAHTFLKLGKIDPVIVLDLFSYLKQEKDEMPLIAASMGFVALSQYLKNTTIFPKFKKLVEDIYGTEKAKKLIFEFNLMDMTEKALVMFGEREPRGYLFAFIKLTELIISKDAYAEADLVVHTKPKSSGLGVLKNAFMSELKHAMEINIKFKENFLKNNYAAVEEWLKRY